MIVKSNPLLCDVFFFVLIRTVFLFFGHFTLTPFLWFDIDLCGEWERRRLSMCKPL